VCKVRALLARELGGELREIRERCDCVQRIEARVWIGRNGRESLRLD